MLAILISKLFQLYIINVYNSTKLYLKVDKMVSSVTKLAVDDREISLVPVTNNLFVAVNGDVSITIEKVNKEEEYATFALTLPSRDDMDKEHTYSKVCTIVVQKENADKFMCGILEFMASLNIETMDTDLTTGLEILKSNNSFTTTDEYIGIK